MMLENYRVLWLQVLIFPLSFWAMFEMNDKSFSIEHGAFVIMAYLVFQIKKIGKEVASSVEATKEENNRLKRMLFTGFLTYSLIFLYVEILFYKEDMWTSQPVLTGVFTFLQVIQVILLVIQIELSLQSKRKNVTTIKEKFK